MIRVVVGHTARIIQSLTSEVFASIKELAADVVQLHHPKYQVSSWPDEVTGSGSGSGMH